MKLHNKMGLWATVTGSCILASSIAQAQNSVQLEEILVTATKREVGLQDVPISISVLSRETIKNKSINELEDAALYLPNVHVGEASTGTQIFIRGIGSGVNFGFDQSVGTFIDGVYFGRGRHARFGFLDLERIEVLKGPQSTLFGQSTVAGAINITTAKPTDEVENSFGFNYTTEVEGIGYNALFSGPLSSTLNGRLVASYSKDKGYVRNQSAKGIDGPQEETYMIRGTLVYTGIEDVDLTFKAEIGSFDVKGRQTILGKATAQATGIYRAVGDKNFTAGLNYQTYSQGVTPDFDNNDSQLYQLDAKIQLGEHTLKSTMAYNRYQYDNLVDVDYSALNFLGRDRTEKYSQFSNEILLSSPTDQTIEYLVGMYYQKNDLSISRNTPIRFSNVSPILTPTLASVNGAINNLAALAGVKAAYAAFLPITSLDTASISNFNQDASSWSPFIEATWHIRESVRLTTGVRYTNVEKKFTKIQTTDDSLNAQKLPIALLNVIYNNILRFTSNHSLNGTRTDTKLTGHINLQADLTEDIMTYINIANGFKGGGFDEDNSLGKEVEKEFEDETVTSFEVGSKMILFNNRASLNLSYFNSNYKDVQVSTFDGVAGFVVGNAASSKVSGIEGDFKWAVTTKLTLNGAFSYLDAKYDNFPGAGCNNGQIQALIASRIAMGQTASTASSGAAGACGKTNNLAGKTLQFAPDFTFNFGANYFTPVTSNINMNLNLDVNWTDDVNVSADVDDNLIQKAYSKINARIAFMDASDRWQVAVVGKNLTDKLTFNWGNDIPLGTLGFAGSYFYNVEAPRTFEFQFLYKF